MKLNARRIWAALSATAIASVMAATIGVVPATASADEPAGPTSIVNGVVLDGSPQLVGQAVMVPDCENLTKGAREYLVEHQIDLCGVLDEPGIIKPFDIRPGLCGSSGIMAYQAGGANILIQYGFQSTVGNMVFRALEVEWSGSAGSDWMLDFSPMNSATYNWSTIRYTGYGLAGVGLGGTATTFYGLTCYLLGPTDSIVVT